MSEDSLTIECAAPAVPLPPPAARPCVQLGLRGGSLWNFDLGSDSARQRFAVTPPDGHAYGGGAIATQGRRAPVAPRLASPRYFTWEIRPPQKTMRGIHVLVSWPNVDVLPVDRDPTIRIHRATTTPP